MRIKQGFTLAEVLITIGIVGLIASITLPALMTNIDKNSWTNGLKTDMSILNNGFKQMMAQEGVDDMRDTALWTEYVKEDVVTPNDDIKAALAKYFKVDKMMANYPKNYPVYNLNGTQFNSANENSIRFYLSNTSSLNIKFLANNDYDRCDTEQVFCHPVAEIVVDVNGDKRPNTVGKDVHFFLLGEDGSIYAYGSEALNKISTSKYPLWDSANGCQGKQPETDGKACTGRVIEEAFQINYN